MTIGRFGPSGLRRPNGKALTSESVQVFLAGTSTSAELFTGLAGTTPLANPVTTDAFGNLTFCAEEGSYDLLVNGARVTVPVDGAPAGGGGGSSSLTLVKATGDYSRNDFGVTYIVDDFFGDPQTFRVIEPNAPVAPGGPTLGVERFGDYFDLTPTAGRIRPDVPGIYDVRFRFVISGANANGNGGTVIFTTTPPVSSTYGDLDDLDLTDPDRFTMNVVMETDSKDVSGPPKTTPASRWYSSALFSGGDSEYDWTDVVFAGAISNVGAYADWGATTKLEITLYPILVDLS